jgi:cell division protein ZipA
VAGRVRITDLVFGFSLPRTHDPLAVFDAMSLAVEYGKKRLGGTITTVEGSPVDLSAMRAEIRTSTRDLVDAGVPAGSDDALQLF